jgi:7-cyano-7-deazaguanine synthase
VLLSGGLDSATVLAVARSQGYETYALTVRYGQRHAAEIDAARRVAETLSTASHIVTDLDLRAFGGSALTDDEVPVPKDDPDAPIADGIPTTYVPARNTILLSLALAWAETLGAETIFAGVNALDYSGYPDCRPEYIAAFERLANLATKASAEGKASFRILAPLIELSKREIIQLGTTLGVDYGLTLSCYDPSADGASCGRCDACRLRSRGFREAGLADPTRYREVKTS